LLIAVLQPLANQIIQKKSLKKPVFPCSRPFPTPETPRQPPNRCFGSQKTTTEKRFGFLTFYSIFNLFKQPKKDFLFFFSN
jgi:hypothetical protein